MLSLASSVQTAPNLSCKMSCKMLVAQGDSSFITTSMVQMLQSCHEAECCLGTHWFSILAAVNSQAGIEQRPNSSHLLQLTSQHSELAPGQGESHVSLDEISRKLVVGSTARCSAERWDAAQQLNLSEKNQNWLWRACVFGNISSFSNFCQFQQYCEKNKMGCKRLWTEGRFICTVWITEFFFFLLLFSFSSQIHTITANPCSHSITVSQSCSQAGPWKDGVGRVLLAQNLKSLATLKSFGKRSKELEHRQSSLPGPALPCPICSPQPGDSRTALAMPYMLFPPWASIFRAASWHTSLWCRHPQMDQMQITFFIHLGKPNSNTNTLSANPSLLKEIKIQIMLLQSAVSSFVFFQHAADQLFTALRHSC